jgi:hypothetical protein
LRTEEGIIPTAVRVCSSRRLPKVIPMITNFGSIEYAFPNDERELERLDMQHAMHTLLLDNKLFWAPIGPSPQTVLDLGTGTGALEIGNNNQLNEDLELMLNRYLGH